jgi:uracil-DNA glycosylase
MTRTAGPSIDSRVAIIGEAWGEHEEAARQPFVGKAGWFLNSMLRVAGIERDDCLVTNVFNMRPKGNRIESLCGPRTEGVPGLPPLAKGKYLLAPYVHHIKRMWKEIEDFSPTVIVAFGNTALWALTGKTGISKYRGSPMQTSCKRWTVLPTYHPAAVLRTYNLRPIVIADLAKAKRHSFTREFRRPSRQLWLEPSIPDLYRFYEEYIVPAPEISVDIETAAEQITMLSIAPTPTVGLVIPFWIRDGGPNYWTLENEVLAWEFVDMVMREKPVIGQNFMYDAQYFWRCYHIPALNLRDDTMLLAHAMQPEMEKSLGFLGSIYTDEPAWKWMGRRGETLKAED